MKTLSVRTALRMVGILKTSFSGENLQNIAAKTLVVILIPSPHMVRKVFLGMEKVRTRRGRPSTCPESLPATFGRRRKSSRRRKTPEI